MPGQEGRAAGVLVTGAGLAVSMARRQRPVLIQSIGPPRANIYPKNAALGRFPRRLLLELLLGHPLFLWTPRKELRNSSSTYPQQGSP